MLLLFLNYFYENVDAIFIVIGNDELGYQTFTADEVESGSGGIGGGQGNTTTTGGDNSSGGGTSDRHHHHRSNSFQALDRLNTKMACTKESIRKEQTARDDNVNEYLKLAANADKQQLQRIKAVFEKKNQKSAHTISQLQKKLESYSKRVKEVQVQQNQRQLGHRQPREVLRDVGQGLKYVHFFFFTCYIYYKYFCIETLVEIYVMV